MSTPGGPRPSGFRRQAKRHGDDPNAPLEPAYRPPAAEPLSPVPMADQFAEMFANDEEAIAWRAAERRADLFGGGSR